MIVVKLFHHLVMERNSNTMTVIKLSSLSVIKFFQFIYVIPTMYVYKNHNIFWNNLSDEQRKAIVDLANDDSIIIKPADKNDSIVIMNSDDYINAHMHVLINEMIPISMKSYHQTQILNTETNLMGKQINYSELINDFEASKKLQN